MTHGSGVKFCQPKTDVFIAMSRSLSRIRNLISEIEEIHRQGQQGGQAALKAASPILSVERVEIPAPVQSVPTQTFVSSPVVVTPVAPAAPAPVPVTAAVVAVATPTPASVAPIPKETPSTDPFLELAQMVNLDEKHTPKTEAMKNEPTQEGKISMQLSGSIALSLQIENTGETVQVKQVGNMLEIHFADGKAFHIPLKTVA